MGLSRPMLLVKTGASGGVFDLADAPPMINVIDATRQGSLAHLDGRVAEWVAGDARTVGAGER